MTTDRTQTLLVRRLGDRKDPYVFELGLLDLKQSGISVAENLDKYFISLVGHTGNGYDLYYVVDGVEEKIPANSDSGKYPRIRVSKLTRQSNISAGSMLEFQLKVDGDLRNSIDIKVEDINPFNIDKIPEDTVNNTILSAEKIEDAQTAFLR